MCNPLPGPYIDDHNIDFVASQQFKDTEKEVLLSERILLQTLGFDLNVVHPYQFFRQIIGKDLKGIAWDPTVTVTPALTHATLSIDVACPKQHGSPTQRTANRSSAWRRTC